MPARLARRTPSSRLSVEHLEDRVTPVTFVVNTTADTGIGVGLVGDLRYCITQANATAGADAITFAIPGAGVQTIAPTTALPAITGAVTIDGYSQPGGSANTLPVGNDAVLLITLDGSAAGAGAAGLTITSANNVVRGLVVTSFDGEGILIQGAAATGNTVAGNFIGTDAAGTAALGNDVGVRVADGASGNTVGGATPADRNLISGNGNAGVTVDFASGNFIRGNYIGTDADGANALPNPAGVVLGADATGNTVGGPAGAGNLISGNFGAGVLIAGDGNTVAGNLIGLTADATDLLGNTDGVVLAAGASGNVIGPGGDPSNANTISGNYELGVRISGAGATGNTVVTNYIGTDPLGTVAMPNGFGGVVIEAGASGNTIGSLAAGEGNLISGNDSDGVVVTDSDGNTVAGNFVGTDNAGQGAIPNAGFGIVIDGDNNTVIGLYLTAGSRQVVSGNSDGGVILSGTGNKLLGTLIGTNHDGTAAIPNGGDGVWVTGFNATVGGTGPNEGNLISGNDLNGVLIDGTPVDGDGAGGNTVLGNFIGTDATGTAAIPNGGSGCGCGGDGVRIDGGATSNTVGGTAPGARNVLSGNASDGVELYIGVTGNVVVGNYIGTDVTGTAALGNQEDGVYLEGAFGNTVGGPTAAERNVISGNLNNGVFLDGNGTNNNIIQGNYIGTNAAGTAGIPNGFEGVFIWQEPSFYPPPGPVGNVVGGVTPGAGNLIAFNTGTGITIGLDTDDASIGNRVLGNVIHSNGGLGIDLGADGVTPNDAADPDLGPNRLQNYPVLGTVTPAAAAGTLNSTPNRTFRVEFFATSAAGQGQVFLGAGDVITDAAGNATFTIPFAVTPGLALVTATATDQTTGDTSEFAAAVGVTIPPLPPAPPPVRLTAVGAGPGGGPQVRVFNPDGSQRFNFFAFDPAARGGVAVATADVTGDGIDDVIAGAGAGGAPHVKVFDGATGLEVASFFAFDGQFRGGVNVGAADLDGDGVAEILTGAGAGGAPHVKVFRFGVAAEVASFFAFDARFRGGVAVAGGTGFLVAGAGAGGGPQVRVFDAATLALRTEFFAFDAAFPGGVSVTADNGLIGVGAGPGGGPQVKVFTPDGGLFADFQAFDPSFRGGVNVGSRAGDSSLLLVGAGPGGGPEVKQYDATPALVGNFFPFDPAFRGGVFVG